MIKTFQTGQTKEFLERLFRACFFLTGQKLCIEEEDFDFVKFVLIVNKHVISFSVEYTGTGVYQKLTKNIYVINALAAYIGWIGRLTCTETTN